MMKSVFRRLSVPQAVGVLLVALLVSVSHNSRAEEVPAGYAAADIKLGGQLYDKWYKVMGVEVTGNHRLYPQEAKKSGADTFRCKECHGWDYIGKDGRYSKGSHYTGIGGVLASRDKSPAVVYDAIASHSPEPLAASASSVWALVKFIREGVMDTRKTVSGEGRAMGDAGAGAPLYKTNCAGCHGSDGNRIDFDDKETGVQGVGWLANDNAQETLHKIRWGHPGSKMPSAVADKGLSDQQTVDLLTYSQSLR